MVGADSGQPVGSASSRALFEPDAGTVASRRTHTLAGVVEDELARPIIGAEISGVEAAVGARRSTSTDGEGRFWLDSLPEGEVLLEVSHLMFASEQLQVSVPGNELRVVLERGADLEGVVVEAGRPVVGARVVAVRRGSGETREVLSTDEGRFSFQRLGLAWYRVTATSGSSVGDADVLIDGENSRAPVVVTLQPTFRVQGTTVDESGAILRGVQVQLSGTDASAVSDEDGRFEVAGLSGTHELTGFLPGYVQRKKVLVSQAAATVRLSLTALGRIRGRVLDSARKALGTVYVDGARVEPTDGLFDISKPAALESLTVGAPNHYPRTIRIGASAPWSDVNLGDIILGGGRRVGVQVRERSTGSAIDGVRVAVEQDGRQFPVGETSDGGRIELLGVPGRASSLALLHPDFAPGTIRLASDSAEVVGLLEGRAELRIQVTDGSGSALAAKVLLMRDSEEPALLQHAAGGEYAFHRAGGTRLAIVARTFSPSRRGWLVVDVAQVESPLKLVLGLAGLVVDLNVATHGAWSASRIELVPAVVGERMPGKPSSVVSLVAGAEAVQLSERSFRFSDAVPGRWTAVVSLRDGERTACFRSQLDVSNELHQVVQLTQPEALDQCPEAQ